MSGKLVDTLYKQKRNIVLANFKTPDTMILNFDSMISTQINDVHINNYPGEKTPLLK
ncbi:MAG: hypothetical protein WCJ45_05630 [bacterium]